MADWWWCCTNMGYVVVVVVMKTDLNDWDKHDLC